MNLPVDELIKTIGLTLALRLVEQRGGRRVYIPTPGRLTEHCVLATIVGIRAASLLAAQWGGEWLSVPMVKGYMRGLRAREIIIRYRDTTAAALAAEYGISERWVLRIIAAGMPSMPEFEKTQSQSPQLGLFE